MIIIFLCNVQILLVIEFIRCFTKMDASEYQWMDQTFEQIIYLNESNI